MSTTIPGRRRQRVDPDERRTAILDAAAQVVVERGLAETRVTDIAQRVGISHGLVHYYFPTKDALVTATMHHLADSDIERLRRAVAAEPTAATQLTRLLRVAIPTSGARDGWVLWVDAWAAGLRDDAVRAVHEELDAAWSRTLEEVIRHGVGTAEFRCADPARAAARLTALVDGLCLRLVLRHRGVTRTGVLSLLQEAAELEVGLETSSPAAGHAGVVGGAAKPRVSSRGRPARAG